jgi:hypothetical protein
MQSLRIVILLVLTLNLVAPTFGQTTSGQKPGGQKSSTASGQAHKPVARKRYCQPGGSFCFKYPGSWTVLGEVFDGNGVVVAPVQKLDKALWDGITVALVAPEPEGDEEAPSVDVIIEQTSQSMREGGQGFETLQRQHRTVDHQPAQMLKVRYHEKATDRDWVEEVVIIQGPDGEMYFVALKCSPENLARLEPVFASVLDSWVLPDAEPPAGAEEESAPKQAPPPPKPAPPDH